VSGRFPQLGCDRRSHAAALFVATENMVAKPLPTDAELDACSDIKDACNELWTHGITSKEFVWRVDEALATFGCEVRRVRPERCGNIEPDRCDLEPSRMGPRLSEC